MSWVQIRIDQEEKEAWQAAAGLAGLSLSEWVKSACAVAIAKPVQEKPAAPKRQAPVKQIASKPFDPMSYLGGQSPKANRGRWENGKWIDGEPE